MKTKHTPGPWSIGAENCGNGRNIYRLRDYIGHTCGYDAKPGSLQRTMTQEEAEANARLIAAAPELLEACKRLLAWWDAPSGCGMDRRRAEERTAIAIEISRAVERAEGGEK